MKNALIIDIDHTIADGGFRSINLADWYKQLEEKKNSSSSESVLEDFKLLQPAADIVRTFLAHNDVVALFVTARSAQDYEPTKRWLIKHGFVHSEEDRLMMRKDGDNRPDWQIKLDLAKNHIEGKYNVVAVFEDKGEVITKCWRELGYKVFQVYS